MLAQNSPLTRATYRRIVDEWFTWCRRVGIDVFEVRRRDVDTYRHHLAGRNRAGGPLGQVTLAQHLAVLSSFYRYAIQEDPACPLEHNPVANVKRPRIANVSYRHSLSLDEARSLLAVSLERPARTAALVHLLLSTGIRVSEACAADVAHVGWNDDGDRAITVTRKGNVRGEVTIPARYWAVIEEYLTTRPAGPEGPILVTTRGRMTRQTAYAIVAELAATVAPRKRIGPHSLRHTAATLALDEGVPIQEVQRMLGHSSAQTTGRYDRAANSRGRAASRALGDLLAAE